MKRPHFEHSVTTLSSVFEPRLGIGEAPPHLVGIAAGRPAFLDPLVGVLLRDDIHELRGRECNSAMKWQPGPTHWIWPSGSSTSGGTSLPFRSARQTIWPV